MPACFPIFRFLRIALWSLAALLPLASLPAQTSGSGSVPATGVVMPSTEMQAPVPATPGTGVLPGNPTATNPTAKADPLRLTVNLEGMEQKGQMSVAVQIVLLMTLLSVAPSLVLLMTSFTRIVIVLGFVRTAIGVPSAPSNQIIVGLSLFLTFFIMGPVIDRVNNEALRPYLDGKLSSSEALDKGAQPLKEFMLKQTRTRDLEYFLELGGFGPTSLKDVPMRVVIPAFIISELRTAFQMGFLIYVPFILIDLVVATVLMSMGMMMMPPTTFSIPLKLLLFVLVDGWELVIRSLVRSFGV